MKAVEGAPQVPKVCEDIISQTLPKLRQTAALVKHGHFEANITENHPVLRGKQDVMNDIKRYVRDIGEIIWLDGVSQQAHGAVVVDVPWLCTDIIGPLFAPSSFAMPSLRACFDDGRFDISKLKLIYQQYHTYQQQQQQQQQQQPAASPRSNNKSQWYEDSDMLDAVVELLQSLNLCYETNTCNEWVIPALLRPLAKQDVSQHWSHDPKYTQFVGRRLLVEHTNTDMFTAGFFPRFQVRAVSVFSDRHILLWQNRIIGLRLEGVQCHVVLCEAGSAVDVMVRVKTGVVCKQVMVDVLGQVLTLLESCRQESCEGTKVVEYALSVRDMVLYKGEPARYDLNELRECARQGHVEWEVAPCAPRSLETEQVATLVPDIVAGGRIHANPTGTAWVMLSYQWDSQDLAIYINNKLKTAGYATWIDRDCMSAYQSLYQGMAAGVDGASAVVMITTSKYQTSINCTHEYRYVAVQKKPFVMLMAEDKFQCSGELGLIGAGALWISARRQTEWDTAAAQLLVKLQTLQVPQAQQP